MNDGGFPGFKSETLDLSGIAIHARIGGAPAAPPLVLLPAGALPTRSMPPLGSAMLSRSPRRVRASRASPATRLLAGGTSARAMASSSAAADSRCRR